VKKIFASTKFDCKILKGKGKMNKLNDTNKIEENNGRLKLNELLKNLLGDKIDILETEFIDDVGIVDDEGERQGHDENTEFIIGLYKKRNFQIEFKRKEKLLEIQYDDLYRNTFEKLTPVLSRIIGARPICGFNEMPILRMPAKYSLIFDTLNPDTTLSDIMRKEQDRSIYNVNLFNGRRKDFYRDNVKQSAISDYAR